MHGSGLHWKYIGDDGWKVTSTHVDDGLGQHASSGSSSRAAGIQVCGVFDGSGTISGSGTYTLNGHKHSWPGHTTRPALLGSGLGRL